MLVSLDNMLDRKQYENAKRTFSVSYRDVSFQLLKKTILWLFKASSLEIMIR